jgi:DNA-binding NtrC family response regulator
MAAHAAALIPDVSFLGHSPSVVALKQRLQAVARAQRTTTIVGPTGSGKELVARQLHQCSPRAARPYVTVHCAALPENLVEAELFGHCRGAFTGATQDRSGLIRSAAQGTLFLDEIDSLALPAQAKLLRFLETGEFRSVGSDRTERSDAWVIAATNRDLHERAREGLFRADLVYRLEVVRLDVPSLRSRGADITLLAEHFLSEIAPGRSFTASARVAMQAYAWPGNVRELKHCIESAALFNSDGPLDDKALALPCPATLVPPAPAVPDAAVRDNEALERELWTLIEGGYNLNGAIGLCERLLIQAALRSKSNNRTRAAERLGIHVRTIYKKLP